VALGSDFPVEDPSPLAGLSAATGHHEGWDPGPARRLTPDQALYAATAEGGAFAGRADVGTLAPGMAADLTVLDVDPVAEPSRLGGARVLLTVVGGRVVHDPLGAFGS
jgi:predicted amidohydrolase YtcJ